MIKPLQNTYANNKTTKRTSKQTNRQANNQTNKRTNKPTSQQADKPTSKGHKDAPSQEVALNANINQSVTRRYYEQVEH